MSRQRTIQREAELSGRGLFTGFPVTARFKPAAAGSGITFVRTDQPEPVRIAARLENLTKRSRRTSLRNGMAAIETVEHCLAAARGLAIDNLVIELDNAELPAADGSARPFVELLQAAGVIEQEAERRYIHITQPTRVNEADAELVAWPGEGDRLEIIYELDYGPGTPIGHQIQRFTVEPEGFAEQIAPVRQVCEVLLDILQNQVLARLPQHVAQILDRYPRRAKPANPEYFPATLLIHYSCPFEIEQVANCFCISSTRR